jgi:hypothetical protein
MMTNWTLLLRDLAMVAPAASRRAPADLRSWPGMVPVMITVLPSRSPPLDDADGFAAAFLGAGSALALVLAFAFGAAFALALGFGFWRMLVYISNRALVDACLDAKITCSRMNIPLFLPPPLPPPPHPHHPPLHRQQPVRHCHPP